MLEFLNKDVVWELNGPKSKFLDLFLRLDELYHGYLVRFHALLI